MQPAILLGLSAIGIVGSVALAALRAGSSRRRRSLASRLASATAISRTPTSLPAGVAELALRIGVQKGYPPSIVHLTQTGSMRQALGSTEMRFRARQIITVNMSSFIWYAEFGPFGLMRVTDYLVDGTGGMEIRLLGAVPLTTFLGGETAAKGEVMRYLAELPWAPDAILHNRELEWRVVDDQTFQLAAGMGARRGQIRLKLGEDGLVATAEASDRPRLEGRSTVERPWRGRFSDYQEFEGRKIPTRGEASWLLDEGELIYWRGTLRNWSALRSIH